MTKPFSPEELLARVKVQLKVKTLQDHLKESNRQLRKLSQTDMLTGLYNRRHMMAALESEFDRSKRTSTPFALLMIDLDHFKEVNDTYGHQQGDEVLKSVSHEIQTQLRQYDSAARFGGEEFALILPLTTLEEGTMVAERLRQIFSKMQFTGPISDLKITASIGIAAIPHMKINSTEDLIRLADDALYMAKGNGRNRVESTLPA